MSDEEKTRKNATCSIGSAASRDRFAAFAAWLKKTHTALIF